MSDERTWQDVANLAEVGVLTASLIHELRQPLFAIRAMTELFLVDGDPPSPEKLEEVLSQARYAERLIQHYGAMSHPDAPVVLLDLNDPVRAAVEMLAHRARGASVDLSFTPSDRPVLVRARPVTVQQVALNLIVNAIDAAQGASGARVWVCTERTDADARLEVHDTGAGIEPTVAGRIFDPFVTSKPVGQGTGLGLSISRERVRADGGDVRLERDGDVTVAIAEWPMARA